MLIPGLPGRPTRPGREVPAWVVRPVGSTVLEKGADVASKDDFGLTPLLLAAWKGHEAVVKLLLEKGADVEDNFTNGRTPLWWGCREGT